jgi:hypothetical protein
MKEARHLGDGGGSEREQEEQEGTRGKEEREGAESVRVKVFEEDSLKTSKGVRKGNGVGGEKV